MPGVELVPYPIANPELHLDAWWDNAEPSACSSANTANIFLTATAVLALSPQAPPATRHTRKARCQPANDFPPLALFNLAFYVGHRGDAGGDAAALLHLPQAFGMSVVRNWRRSQSSSTDNRRRPHGNPRCREYSR